MRALLLVGLGFAGGFAASHFYLTRVESRCCAYLAKQALGEVFS